MSANPTQGAQFLKSILDDKENVEVLASLNSLEKTEITVRCCS